MSIVTRGRVLAVLVLLCGLFASPSFAQNPAPKPPTRDDIAREEAESWKAGFKAAVIGPGDTALAAQGRFRVPEKMAFIPMPEAGRIMRAIGNSVGPRLIGLVTSIDDNEQWFATVSYLPKGYIRDDDAREWDADELLQNLREGTAESNKDRKARGFPELEILGWIEKPTYASAEHKLVWSAALREKGGADDQDRTVNYNTYVLGREGYLSLNFVTEGSQIEGQKPLVRTLLAGLQFVPGKRYEEFNASTDKVAAYGLAALVGGAVLKKAGLFAIVAAFLAKFAKVGIFIAVALLGGLVKFFRRGSGEA